MFAGLFAGQASDLKLKVFKEIYISEEEPENSQRFQSPEATFTVTVLVLLLAM